MKVDIAVPKTRVDFLTYSTSEDLNPGDLVLVPIRKKTKIGIVVKKNSQRDVSGIRNVEEIIQRALTVTQQKVDVAKTEGEVLFLDHRQLLTFGYVEDVPLVNDYEKKLLMEMAMQGRGSYFESFYQDLADHRFSLIITEPLHTGIRETAYQFGDENNAWVQWVSLPLLCYYEPSFTSWDVSLQILVPKTKSPPGEGLACPAY